jgi:hypothetical protein
LNTKRNGGHATVRAIAAAVVILLLGTLIGPSAMAQTETSEQPLISSDVNGVTLTWTPPDYTLATQSVDGASYAVITMPNTTATDAQPGHPALPAFRVPVGIPYDSHASLDIVSVETTTADVSHPLIPAGAPQTHRLGANEESMAALGPMSYQPDPNIYQTNALYPQQVASLGPVQQMRGNQLVNLTIYPVRFNPVTRQLSVVRSVELRVNFSQSGPSADLPAATTDVSNPIGQAMSAVLANPEAATWTGRPKTDSLNDAQIAGTDTTNEIKVVVDDSGLYQITYAALQSMGLNVSTIDKNTLRLTRGYPRQEVAVQIDDANQRILFHAQPQWNRYSDEFVYFLSHSNGDGQRMTDRACTANGSAGVAWRSTTVEENHEYDSTATARNGDHWYWEMFKRGLTTSDEYTIQLSAPRTDIDATLTVWVYGITTGSHQMRAALNGTNLGDHTWSGAGTITATFTIPGSLLRDGSNTASLSLPGTANESMWVDALAITYATGQVGGGQLAFAGESGQKDYTLTNASSPKVYDVTNSASPQHVTGCTLNGTTLTVGDVDSIATNYLVVPANTVKNPLRLEHAAILNDPGAGADYIIITHPDLASSIAPLANYHTSQGLRVVTVNVTDIYDAYGPGHLDPPRP